jgi:membrane protein DedA with SNARE-associated domain
MGRDRTFLIILGGLFVFMCLFGIGATILGLVGDASDQVTLRVLGAIGSMFSSVVGLILGYIVGRRNGNGGATP